MERPYSYFDTSYICHLLSYLLRHLLTAPGPTRGTETCKHIIISKSRHALTDKHTHRPPPPPPQPFYSPFSGTTRVSRCQKRTSGLWCKGRLTKADILIIRLGATPSGLTSAHLHHPPITHTESIIKCSSDHAVYCYILTTYTC